MEDIVNRYIKDKSKKDFEKIYQNTFDDLYRFVLSKTNNIEVTQEIVSDTYYTLLEIIDKYDSSRSKFTTFLFGIALNKLRQRWSKEKAIKTFSLNEDIEIEEIDNTDSNKRKKLISQIWEYIPTLSDKYRNVILKRFIESKSINEVSKELNISISNVTTIQNRAINKLRELVNEQI